MKSLCEIRKTPRILTSLLLCAAANLTSVTAQAGVYYRHTFTSDGNLSNTPVETQSGSEQWNANATCRAEGGKGVFTGSQPDGDNAFLPFTPSNKEVYRLKAELQPVSASNNDWWFALGYSLNANKTERFFYNDALGLKVRVNGEIISHGPSGNVSHGTYSFPLEAELILDTRHAQWRTEWILNGTSVRSDFFTTNPSITQVGFGRSNDVTGSIDDFALLQEDWRHLFSVVGGALSASGVSDNDNSTPDNLLRMARSLGYNHVGHVIPKFDDASDAAKAGMSFVLTDVHKSAQADMDLSGLSYNLEDLKSRYPVTFKNYPRLPKAIQKKELVDESSSITPLNLYNPAVFNRIKTLMEESLAWRTTNATFPDNIAVLWVNQDNGNRQPAPDLQRIENINRLVDASVDLIKATEVDTGTPSTSYLFAGLSIDVPEIWSEGNAEWLELIPNKDDNNSAVEHDGLTFDFSTYRRGWYEYLKRLRDKIESDSVLKYRQMKYVYAPASMTRFPVILKNDTDPSLTASFKAKIQGDLYITEKRRLDFTLDSSLSDRWDVKDHVIQCHTPDHFNNYELNVALVGNAARKGSAICWFNQFVRTGSETDSNLGIDNVPTADNNPGRVPNEISLVRQASLWDNFWRVPVDSSNRFWNKDQAFYASPYTFVKNSIVFSINPINGKLYATFLNNSAHISLEAGVTIGAIHRANAYWENNGDGSSDMTITNYAQSTKIVASNPSNYPASYIIEIDRTYNALVDRTTGKSQTTITEAELNRLYKSPFHYTSGYDNTWAQNPILAYDFNEGSGNTALDSAGSNNGSLRNGANFSSDSKEGSHSLNLGGVDEFLQTNSGVDLRNTEFTIACWVKLSASVAATRVPIFGNRNSGNTTSGFTTWINYNNTSDRTLGVKIADGSNIDTMMTLDSVMPDEEWVHIALRYRENGWTAMRLNAESPELVNMAGDLLTTFQKTGQFFLGKENNHFKGKIDDFRIYPYYVHDDEVGYLMYDH